MSVEWMRSGIITYLYEQWDANVDPHVCADYIFDNNYYTLDYDTNDREIVYRSIYKSVRKQYRLLDRCEEIFTDQAQGNPDNFVHIIEEFPCSIPRSLGRIFLEKQI